MSFQKIEEIFDFQIAKFCHVINDIIVKLYCLLTTLGKSFGSVIKVVMRNGEHQGNGVSVHRFKN